MRSKERNRPDEAALIPDFDGNYIFSHEDGPKLLHFSVQCAKLKEYEVIVHGYASERINF